MSAFVSLLALLALAQEPLLPPAPAGWRGERLTFPLDFAPDLDLAGAEDLLFAPGMFAPDSETYFSYALAVRMQGDLEVDAAFLEDFLARYYRGLCRAVAGGRKLAFDEKGFAVHVAREGERFRASVDMIDAFTDGRPLTLALELESWSGPGTTELLGLASPLDAEAPVWAELHALGAAWRAARPAPLFLNHLYLVPDRATYDALAASPFVRESLAVFEERETVRADGTYRGLYLYGRRTYVEFLPPGAMQLEAGASGLAFGLEQAGATDSFQQRLTEKGVASQAFPITRALEGAQVPWFRLLGIEMPSAPLTLFALEYDARFLSVWHGERAPAGGGIARAAVLERYAAVLGRSDARPPMSDVTTVHLALDEAQRARLLAVCAAGGHAVEEVGGTWRCRGPQVTLVLEPSPEPRGITGFELALREPLVHEPLELGRVRLRFEGAKATLTLR